MAKFDYLSDVFFNLLNSHEFLLNFYNNDIHQNRSKLKNVELLIRTISSNNKFI